MAEPATRVPTKPEEKAIKRGTEAWLPFESLRAEIDRLFDDFSPEFLEPPSWSRPQPSSAASVQLGGRSRRRPDRKGKQLRDDRRTSGNEEKDVEVSVSNGTLTIRGEKQEAKEEKEKEKEYVLSKRRFGSFRRTFKIPEDVKTDDIAATFSKGVLTLTLPKAEEARQDERKIQINTD